MRLRDRHRPPGVGVPGKAVPAEPTRLLDWMATVTLRLAGPGDRAAVGRLAALDDAPAPAGPVLLAERDGRPVAARSLADGAVVADPFARTARVERLLAVHADGVRPRRPRWRGGG